MTSTSEKNKDAMMRMRDVLERANLRYCLCCSTLLGIYRDKEPIGKILEVDILEQDFPDDAVNRINDICPIIRKRTSDSGYSIFDLQDFQERPFEIQIMRTTDKYAYKNLVGKDCLVWPKYMFDKYDTIEWNGVKWNTPTDVENYLKAYYGSTWRTPAPWGWHDASNYRQLDEVLKGEIIFQELTQ